MFRGEPLRDFALGERPLEIGRGAGCDVVVHDPALADRHYVVSRVDQRVVLHDLLTGQRRELAIGVPIGMGRHHEVVSVTDVTRPSIDAGARTEPLGERPSPSSGMAILVGEGADARRYAIGDRPVVVGKDAACDLTLPDRAVSARHCRFEPTRRGMFVRDLGSRNGTCVDGVSIGVAEVSLGSTVKIGRSTLTLIATGEGAPAELGLVVESSAMRDVMLQVERLARYSWPVLVRGESGVGKEGVARALHLRGPRREGPFVAVNAGGMPSSLIESELFGHERGAFTGAASVHRGVFEQAHGGTLFLDEVGELSLELQSRLLRVLESWEVRRLGAERAVAVDVKLVCATHRDLAGMVRAGTMRQDLYFRLAQLAVYVPPLRERPADLTPLAERFLAEARAQVGPRRFDRGALSALAEHGWPGNVRELRNVVRQAAVMCASSTVQRADVERALERLGVAVVARPHDLTTVLDEHGGNVTAAARALGIPRTTLRGRLRAHRRDDGAGADG
ncbi:MAG: sigma 54-interacting transcriptional regulator [Sandaracinaceae bacterium]